MGAGANLDGVMRVAELYSIAQPMGDDWPDADDPAWRENMATWRPYDPIWAGFGYSAPVTATNVRNILNMMVPPSVVMTWDPAHRPRRLLRSSLRPRPQTEQQLALAWEQSYTQRAHLLDIDELEFDDEDIPPVVISRLGIMLAVRGGERRPLALFLQAVQADMARQAYPIFYRVMFDWMAYLRYLRLEAFVERQRRPDRGSGDDAIRLIQRTDEGDGRSWKAARLLHEFRGRWDRRYDVLPLPGRRHVDAIYAHLINGMSRLVDEVLRPQVLAGTWPAGFAPHLPALVKSWDTAHFMLVEFGEAGHLSHGDRAVGDTSNTHGFAGFRWSQVRGFTIVYVKCRQTGHAMLSTGQDLGYLADTFLHEVAHTIQRPDEGGHGPNFIATFGYLLTACRERDIFPDLPRNYTESKMRPETNRPLSQILPPELRLTEDADDRLDPQTLLPDRKRVLRDDDNEEDTTLEPPHKRRRDALRTLLGTITGSKAQDNALMRDFMA